MRIQPNIKKNSIIIALIIALFCVPFCTTFLLDVPIIKINIARQILVYFLLLIEIVVIGLLLQNEIKNEPS